MGQFVRKKQHFFSFISIFFKLFAKTWSYFEYLEFIFFGFSMKLFSGNFIKIHKNNLNVIICISPYLISYTHISISLIIIIYVYVLQKKKKNIDNKIWKHGILIDNSFWQINSRAVEMLIANLIYCRTNVSLSKVAERCPILSDFIKLFTYTSSVAKVIIHFSILFSLCFQYSAVIGCIIILTLRNYCWTYSVWKKKKNEKTIFD